MDYRALKQKPLPHLQGGDQSENFRAKVAAQRPGGDATPSKCLMGSLILKHLRDVLCQETQCLLHLSGSFPSRPNSACSSFVFSADCALCLDAVTTVEIPARILLLRRGPGAPKPAAPLCSPPCSQESGTM